MKKIVPLIILLAVAVIAAVVYFRWTERRPPATTLKISGNIEAHESVVGFKVQGRLVELPVEEGQYVHAGDLIATLDRNDYLQQVNTDEAVLRTRQAELALAQAGSRAVDNPVDPLVALTHELQLGRSVEFVNRFIEISELCAMLSACDRLREAVDPAGLFPVTEGIFLGCGEATSAQRDSVKVRPLGTAFSSCTIAVLRISTPRGRQEWWREVYWEVLEQRPLRGRREA